MASMTFSAPCGRDGIFYTTFKADFKEQSALLRYLFLGCVCIWQYFSRLPMDKTLICTFLFVWQAKASI
jgi:hypothetical protein